DAFHLESLDLERLKREGLPEIRLLLPPYIPEAARIWIYGATESYKSLCSLWWACELSRLGVHVIYISQEIPLAEDVRRLEKLRPDWRFLHFFWMNDLDLKKRDHRAELFRTVQDTDARLVVLDTFTACWRGKEDSNDEVRDFDDDVQVPLVRAGVSILVIHHVGRPGQVPRRGVDSGRGASTQEQKADFVLTFKPYRENG